MWTSTEGLLFLFFNFFLSSIIFGQKCIKIESETPPATEEACTDCGNCQGNIPEISSLASLNNTSDVGADGLLFGLGNMSHDDVKEDWEEDNNLPMSGDQVVSLGEFIDEGINMSSLVDCYNFNCFNAFEPSNSHLGINIGRTITDFLFVLDTADTDLINTINDHTPAEYQGSNYYESLRDEHPSSWPSSGEINNSIVSQLTEQYPGMGESFDLNYIVESLFGLSPSSSGDYTPCDLDPIRSIRQEDEQGLKSVSGNFAVMDNVDIFSTRIPGTSKESADKLLPSPSDLSMIQGASDNVGLYNGNVDVNTPIHTITSNDISIPIAISTKGNGVRIDDLGTEVGTNSRLSAGGAITRIVNNLPDEYINLTGREVGEGRGPSSVLKPCVTFDIGGTNLFCRRKKVEWNPLSPTEIRFNVSFGPVKIFIGPFPLILYPFITIVVKLNVRTKPDYYKMVEKGVGFQHIASGSALQAIDPSYTEGGIDISLFEGYSDTKKGRILAMANGRKTFDDQTFISSTLGVIAQFFNGITNLFGDITKTYSNLDLQADEFHYEFPGYTGKFIVRNGIRGSKIITSMPANDLKITQGNVVTIDGNRHIPGFEVETPEGLVYTFGAPNGGALVGVEFSQHTTYNLPNYITYPTNGLSLGKYKGAAIDQSAYPFSASVLCYPRALQYGSTYENLYTVIKSPKYTSSWKLMKVRSLLTKEEVHLRYRNIENVQYNQSKTLTHKIPNFGTISNNGNGKFTGRINHDLNPFNISEYTNLKGEFSYSLTEVNQNVLRLIEIEGERLEKAVFIYDQDRSDLVDDKLLTMIQIRRNNELYRYYSFEYDEVIQHNAVDCDTQGGLSELPVSEHGFSFKFKDPLPKWHAGMDNMRSLLYKIGIKCRRGNGLDNVDELQNVDNFYKRDRELKSFRFPLILQTFPQYANNLRILDEYGSIAYVKQLQSLRHRNDPAYAYDEDQVKLQYQAESNRSFLKKVSLNGNQGESVDLVQFKYYGGLNLPKRFSTQQDKWGYFNPNPSNSPFPPLRYSNFEGNLVDKNDAKLDHHFDFLDVDNQPNLLNFSDGRKEEVDLQSNKTGSLQAVVYPTGGYTKYEYELNDVVSEEGILIAENSGAGLRISSKKMCAEPRKCSTTSYSYYEPSVVNDAREIVETPFDKSDYDVSNIINSIQNISCPGNLAFVDKLFDIITNDEADDDRCGGPLAMERLVTVSSNPQNNWTMNGSSYVGYGKVRETLGTEEENIGYTEYDFITPTEIGVQKTRINNISRTVRSLVFNTPYTGEGNNYENIPPYGQLTYNKNAIGLEQSAMAYNSEGVLVSRTINEYELSSIPNCNLRHLRGSYNRCTLVSGIRSKVYSRKYPGNFLVNLVYGKLSSLIVRSNPKARIMVRLLSEGIFIPHPYKVIEHDNLYTLDQFLMDYPRLISSTTDVYFDDGSSNYTTVTNSYRQDRTSLGTQGYRLKSSTTETGNPTSGTVQTSSVNYAFIGDNPTLLNGATSSYFRSFGRSGGYSVPIKTTNYTNGTLTNGQRTNYVKGIGGDNGKVYVKDIWKYVSSEWQLSTTNKAWDSSTVPTESYIAEYTNDQDFDSSNDVLFGKRINYLNDNLQTIKIVSYDNSESGVFGRLYEYNEYGELIKLRDENNVESTYKYDGLGRLKESIKNNNRIIGNFDYSYLPPRISSTTKFVDGSHPDQTTEQTFNGLGMPLSLSRTDGAVLQSNRYDGYFRTVASKQLGSPLTATVYESSPLSRVVSQTSGGNVTSFTYSAAPPPPSEYEAPDFHQLTITTDPNGHSSQSVNDGLGRTTFTRSAEGAQTKYIYDPFGRIQTIINPIGENYSFSYNGFGALFSRKVPNADTEYIYYDSKYRQLATKNALGAMVATKYGPFNRPVNTYLFKQGESNINLDPVSTNIPDALYSSARKLTTVDYVANKTWPRSINGNRLTAENDLGSGVATTFVRNNIGQVTGVNSVYDGVEHTVNTVNTISDAGLVTSSLTQYTGAFNLNMTKRTVYDNVLRPFENHIKAGANDEILTSRTIYNSEDQVDIHFIGKNPDNNSFLQRVKYSYDASTYGIVKINEPFFYSCSSDNVGTEFCEFNASYRLRGFSDCTKISGVKIDDTYYAFSQSIDLYNQNELASLASAVQTVFQAQGYDATFEQTSRTNTLGNYYSFVVNNLPASDFSLVFTNETSQNCNDLLFTRDNCCTPSGYVTGGNNIYGTTTSSNLYYQELEYDGLDIEWIEYAGDCYLGKTRYDFEYDMDHRLRAANHTIFRSEIIEDAYSTEYSYDPAGNILTLHRNGRYDNTALPESALFGQIDALTYTYVPDDNGLPTSRLKSIIDAADNSLAQPFGFSATQSDYGFDSAGNLEGDAFRALQYNAFNQPREIVGGGEKHELEYLPNGNLFARSVEADNETKVRRYLHGLEIVDNKPESYEFGNGRILFDEENGQRIQYRLSDHLGNTVVLFEDKNNDGTIQEVSGDAEVSEVLQRKMYYPFGMALKGTAPIQPDTDQRYLYNGKEYQEELGLYDYGARWYDPAVARWLQVDPLADHPNQIHVSPYHYVANNPVLHTDPDGKCPPWICGALAGATLDYGLQVVDNLAQGKDLGDALTDVDGTSIATSAALGAVGGGLISKAGKLLKTGRNAKKAVEAKKLNDRASRLNKVDRSGKDFTQAGKDVVKRKNALKNDGKMRCESCGRRVRNAKKSEKGRTPPKNEGQVDHIRPKSRGGRGNPDNGQVLCRGCNRRKSNN